MMQMDVERIRQMEARLNKTAAAVSRLDRSLDEMDETREDMIRLFRYYGSDNWYADREGDLPADVPAGVLSEDAVYDAITDLRAAALRMLKLAADILENRI